MLFWLLSLPQILEMSKLGLFDLLLNMFRGLIMGIWNSHTSIGNVLGNTIAGAFVEVICGKLASLILLQINQTNWGLSFMVPGIGIASAGLIMFFLLAPSPEDAGFQPEQVFDKLNIHVVYGL